MITLYFNYEENFIVATKEERDYWMENGSTFFKVQNDTVQECLADIKAICDRIEQEIEQEIEQIEQIEYETGYSEGRKMAYKELREVNFDLDVSLTCSVFSTHPHYGDGFIDGFYDELKRWED